MNERLSDPNQSGFRPFDSCKHQLLVITHDIFEAFDCNSPLDVRSVFSDISKPLTRFAIKAYFIKSFDKVSHQELLYKLKSMGISGEPYSLL